MNALKDALRAAGVPLADLLTARTGQELPLESLSIDAGGTIRLPSVAAPELLYPVTYVAAAEGQAGFATSVDPDVGHPDILSVWSRHESRWKIDRRSTRTETPGEGLDRTTAELAADLVDRVQLTLGIPVEIAWVMQGRRAFVAHVREMVPKTGFEADVWQRLALVAADEGTVAPLAVDTLDLALRTPDGHAAESTARRVYARPYRRRSVEDVNTEGLFPAAFGAALRDAGTVMTEVGSFLVDAFALEHAFEANMQRLDEVDLVRLNPAELLAALRDRQRVAADAIRQLDRGRSCTRLLLRTLEAAADSIDKEQRSALVSVKHVRVRRKFHRDISALAAAIEKRCCGLIPELSEFTREEREEFDKLLKIAAELRPLGLDVRPVPFGHDAAELLRNLRHRLGPSIDDRERARSAALASLVKRAEDQSRGRGAMAQLVGVMLSRTARAKGGVAEAVSASLWRLRGVALELGRRLVADAVLDEADDALYLSALEIEDAMRGEPGAYTARVRLRREDDLRWANFAAPRAIGVRPS